MSQLTANPIESPLKSETIDEISEGISQPKVESPYEFDANEVITLLMQCAHFMTDLMGTTPTNSI